VARARKIQRFLSQPFHVAEVFTGSPGKYVTLAETIRGFKMIVSGECDHLPEQAFYMVGTIDEAFEKAKKLAAERGLDTEMITRMAAGGGRGGRGGGPGGGGRGEGGAPRRENTFTTTITTRTLYRITNPDAEDKDKRIESVSVKLGVSDGLTTEVLEGLKDGDTLLTGVIMPGAVAAAQPPPGSSKNPFQGRSMMGGSSRGR